MTSNILRGSRRLPLLSPYVNVIPFMRDPVRFMQKMYANYGGVVSLARGTTQYIFVFGAKYNRRYLAAPISLPIRCDVRHDGNETSVAHHLAAFSIIVVTKFKG